MWSRKELKSNAKAVLKLKYWMAVLFSFVLTVISGGFAGSVSASGYDQYTERYAGEYSLSTVDLAALAVIFSVLASFVLVGILVGEVLKIFAFSPLEVSCRLCFLDIMQAPGDLNRLGFAFKNSYKNIVLIQFLRYLFIGLWSLLLWVPGIMKAYEYRMIPFLLAENPGMDRKEAFARSKEMMNGEKWNAFVLDLSFWGWWILGLFTCGILYIFYVNPYYNLTCTELYQALKQKSAEGNPS